MLGDALGRCAVGITTHSLWLCCCLGCHLCAPRPRGARPASGPSCQRMSGVPARGLRNPVHALAFPQTVMVTSSGMPQLHLNSSGPGRPRSTPPHQEMTHSQLCLSPAASHFILFVQLDPTRSSHGRGRCAASFCAQAVPLLLELCRSFPGSCVPALCSAGAVRELFLNNLKQGSGASREAAQQLLAVLAIQVAEGATLHGKAWNGGLCRGQQGFATSSARCYSNTAQYCSGSAAGNPWFMPTDCSDQP